MPKKPKKNKNKTVYENIVGGIIYGGSSDEKRAAWRLMKSESAKNEAELVAIYQQAQAEIVAELSRLTANDLVTYHTEAALQRVNAILGKMLGNSEELAKNLAIANVLAGRIRSLALSQLKEDELVSAVSLTSVDMARVERMVEQLIGNLQNCAAFAMTSVRNTVQNVSVRANMPQPIDTTADDKKSEKSKKEIEKQAATQTPISNQFSAQPVDKILPKKPKLKLSNKEYAEIIKNPVLFANKSVNQNTANILKLRNEYVLGRRENDPLRSSALRSQALKEAKGSSVAKAAFDMQEQLRREGVSAFVDRGGHRWSLANYCTMATRTTSRQSANFGEVFAKEDHDLYYIVPHGSSCPICSKYEGRVYSRSGTNPNYPPLSSAFSKIDPNGTDDLENTYFTIHPNCRHTIVRFIERAQTKEKLEEIRRKSNRPFEAEQRTPEQIAEYKQEQQARASRNAAMREFLAMLQVLPAKDLGNFPRFRKHYEAKDPKYQELKQRYKALSNGKKPSEEKSETATPQNKEKA